MTDLTQEEFRTLLTGLVSEDGNFRTRVCRVCLKTANDIVKLSDTCTIQVPACAGTYTLAEILSYITHEQVYDCGVLPLGVCGSCVSSCVEAFVVVRGWRRSATALERCVDALSLQADAALPPKASRRALAVLPSLSMYADLPAPPEQPRACTLCPRVLASASELRDHLATHPQPHRHACVHCGNTYRRGGALDRHVAQCHADAGSLRCVLCNNHDTFTDAYSLFCHQMLRHGATRLYYCSCCGYRGRSEGAMLRHFRLHHPQDPDAHYQVLEPNDELRERLTTPPAPPDAPHSCDACSAQFPRAALLRRHMEREHRRRYECAPCRKMFRMRSRYDLHMRLHTTHPDLKPYKCMECGYTARQRRHVVAHASRRHSSVRPCACTVCGKGFVKPSEVRAHMVTHTRERRETCPVCDKRLVSKAALIYHTRLHTGEKPYECDACGERFLSASRRGAHVRSKHGPRPACHLCGATYTNKQVLHKHLRNVHMRELIEADAVAADQ